MLPFVVRASSLHYEHDRESERFYFVLRLEGWKLDVSLWARELPPVVEEFQASVIERLADDELRLTLLRLKEAWWRRPEYPETVSAWQIYDAAALLKALTQREEMASTAQENGVAIPHPHRPLPSAVGDTIIAYGRTASGTLIVNNGLILTVAHALVKPGRQAFRLGDEIDRHVGAFADQVHDLDGACFQSADDRRFAAKHDQAQLVQAAGELLQVALQPAHDLVVLVRIEDVAHRADRFEVGRRNRAAEDERVGANLQKQLEVFGTADEPAEAREALR